MHNQDNQHIFYLSHVEYYNLLPKDHNCLCLKISQIDHLVEHTYQ